MISRDYVLQSGSATVRTYYPEIRGGTPGIHEDARLWPNELHSERTSVVGFTGVFATLPRSAVDTPINSACGWGSVDDIRYDNVGLGHLVFAIDAGSGKATSVRLEAFREIWDRVQ